MKNFKLTISYDGSRYSGWERQPGRDTIQGKLETVLSRMVNAEVNVIGAGRTVAGVPARWLQTVIWKPNCSRTKSATI